MLFNEFFAPRCLVICSKNPQLPSHIHICPKPKVKLGPTETVYLAPPSLIDIATARNPSLFGLTNRDLGPTEIAIQTLCFLFVTFHFNRDERIGPTEFA